MFDFDPRDYDGARDPRDRDERDRDDDDALTLGRGPSAPQVDDHHDERRDRDDDRRHTHEHADHRDRDDARWPDRDLAPRDRGTDPRDVFSSSERGDTVTVRFRPEVAPWVREFFAEHEAQADGSVLVRFSASSKEWLTRRVLEFGADAEVVEPAQYREAVRRAIAWQPQLSW